MKQKFLILIVFLFQVSYFFAVTPIILVQPESQYNHCRNSPVIFYIKAKAYVPENDRLEFTWQFNRGGTWTENLPAPYYRETGYNSSDSTFYSKLMLYAPAPNYYDYDKFRCIVKEYNGNDFVGYEISNIAELTFDSVPPSLTTKNVVIYLDDNGQATISTDDVVASSSDNCQIQETTLSRDVFYCSDVGDVSIDVTVVDNNNNSTTRPAIVTVLDTTSPALYLKNDTAYLDYSGKFILSGNYVIDTIIENCSVADTIFSRDTFDCSKIGENQIFVTVTDVNGNTKTKPVILTVLDTLPPILSLKNDTLYLDSSGSASLTASDVLVSATDNCGIQDTTISQTAFDCSNIGENQVIITVSDASGNMTSKTVTITVADTLSPALTVQNATVYLDETGSASITASDVLVSASDNCAVQDTIISQTAFDCSNIGENQVIITVSDASGNMTSKTVTITVADTLSPALAVQNATVYLDETGSARLTASDVLVSATDNCGIQDTIISQTAFDCSNIGENQVIITVSDINGNITKDTVFVTVADTLAPVITACVNDTTVEADEAHVYIINGTDFDITATDNCGSVSITNDFNNTATLDGAELPEGTHTITWTATDEAGNISQCVFTITVNEYAAVSMSGEGISVYPNPVRGKLTFVSGRKTGLLQLSDFNGKVIANYTVSASRTELDLSFLPAGMYLLRFITSDGVYSVKVLKQ